jgi:hypothetical protein
MISIGESKMLMLPRNLVGHAANAVKALKIALMTVVINEELNLMITKRNEKDRAKRNSIIFDYGKTKAIDQWLKRLENFRPTKQKEKTNEN